MSSRDCIVISGPGFLMENRIGFHAKLSGFPGVRIAWSSGANCRA